MAITEQTRHDLYEHFIETMGEERAMAMMEHLPVGGAATLATKQDVQALREWATGRFDAMATTMATKEDLANLRGELKSDIANLRAEMHSVIRTHTIALVTANAAVGAVVITAARWP